MLVVFIRRIKYNIIGGGIMGEKDITQKNFEAYNDVVADIVNGSLFDGEEIIKADSLIDAQPFSQYKADKGTVHEQ